MPADCAPAALARAIRAGTEHGITLGMRELPPAERVSGLADGSLGYAGADRSGTGRVRVPLGLASAPVPDGTQGCTPRRTVHLEELRPRRGRTAAPAAPRLSCS